MTLSSRMKTIISECGFKQKEFAQSINVTESYISKVLRDESGMSNSTAMLIEKLYGYSKNWIMTGSEPKTIARHSCILSALQKKIILNVENMNKDELQAVLAFINCLKKNVIRP